jgi:Tfp pilus assembly protein PilF
MKLEKGFLRSVMTPSEEGNGTAGGVFGRQQAAEEQYHMGCASFQLNQYPQAIAYFKKAIELKQDYEDAYYYMGFAYEKLGDQSHAVIYCRKAAQLGHKEAQKRFYEKGLNWW